jgi:hypothetical protein
MMMLVGGLLTLVSYYVFGTTVLSVMIPVFIVVTGTMLVFTNTFACAFADVGHIAGYAGAAYSGIQLSGAVLFSAVISHFTSSNVIFSAGLFILSALLSFVVYKFVATR